MTRHREHRDSASRTAIVTVDWRLAESPSPILHLDKWLSQIPKLPSVEAWVVQVGSCRGLFCPRNDCNTVYLEHADCIWCVESARNAIIRSELKHVSNVICMDNDLIYEEADWLESILSSLERHPIVQGFETGRWLGRDGSEIAQRKSILCGHLGDRLSEWPATCSDTYHVGFCWAARRDFWTEGPGIPDWVCFGANDRALALACTNHQHHQWTGWWRARLDSYTADLHRWMGREKAGYAPLTVRHLWHGDVKNRRYSERSTRLSKVDWPKHCRYNEDGLLAWTDEGHKLHNEWFKKTMMLRQNED